VRRRASEAHVAEGRRLVARGHLKEALDAYRLALDLDPSRLELRDEMGELERRRADGDKPRSIADVKKLAREKRLPGLEIDPALDMPVGLQFEGTDVKEAYRTLGLVAGVNFVFDTDLRATPVTLELKNASFDDALQALASASRTFVRATGAKLIQVLPDTPAKRRDYEDQIVKTLFLSNADMKEVVDVLRISLGARRVAPVPASNAILINDTPERVAAAERIVEMIDKRRGEVIVEIEILEVNRQKLQDYGIEINSTVGLTAVTPGAAIGAFPDPTKGITLDSADPYRRENVVVSGLPGVIARFLQTVSATRLVASPHLRVTEGQAASARFGDQVPIPVTTFSSLATGGGNTIPFTSFEYKNVGVNIDITPRVHHDSEVTLALKVEVSSVGAPGFGGYPTFSTRNVASTSRLKDGETTMLAGLITDRERTSLSSVPGLAEIPLLGRLFGRNQKDASETDIIMTLTPRIVHRPEFSLEDLKSFSVGSESSPLLFEVPATPPPSATPVPPPGIIQPLRPEPVRPPAPPAPLPTPTPR
jgi:general secretion pathway protein D